VTEIVHFLHALNDRTIADIACCLADEMHAAGRQTVVVASSVTPGARRPRSVEVIDLGGAGRRTLPTTRELARTLRHLDPSTVFAHAEGPARAALAVTKALRIRAELIGIVHNHHSSYEWSHARLRRVVDRLLLPRLDALVGVSPGVADDLRETFPAAADRVHMVPSPLTRWKVLPQLAAEPFEHPWFDGARPVLVTVGHVHARNDHETLVRAIAVLRDRGADVPRVAIIGSDGTEHAARVRALIESLGLDDDIALLGALDNPMPHVAAADGFVLSSRNEGLGIVLLEAMGLGTPIVSTDAPSGPRWVLEDGRAGLLAPVGDPPALAAAIQELLTDAATRERLTAAGRRRAGEFTPTRVARDYLDLADSLR
jgi:glycosyltransferase involved in cell wall biosynthesis